MKIIHFFKKIKGKKFGKFEPVMNTEIIKKGGFNFNSLQINRIGFTGFEGLF